MGWAIGGLALVVAVIMVSVGVLSRVVDAPSPPPPPGAQRPSEPVCPEAAEPTETAIPPSSGDQVTSGKLSYPRLGPPFDAPSWDSRTPFGVDVATQTAVVETVRGGERYWVAQVLIARLAAGDGFFDPEQGAAIVAECITGLFYFDAEVVRDDQVNKAVTIGGRPGWLIESQLRFDLRPDIRTRGELMIVCVIDTGDGEAGLFYASIPDTSPQFVQPARDAFAKLSVAP